MGKIRKIIVAIDGPAASGKSTTAREVAKKLGYTYIDSGAMYRAVTLRALQEKVPVEAQQQVAELAQKMELKFGWNNARTIIYMDGEDVSEKIRTPLIDQKISPVAANPLVRRILVRKQQQLGRVGGVVMDGRDIGTVVFPQAELKIFMIARVQERALRRQKELEQKGMKVDLEKIIADMEYRDQQDAGRSHGPLKKADDAVEIDTTGLTIPEQVDRIYRLAMEKISETTGLV
ncbi:MAG: cytidylate kinase [Caldithrix sp. RBG_13_44_9]|nr:MAG: cytidylate kinase [Caldithrix sp. RBG_13_44_9]